MNGDLISRKALLEEINGEENRRADALMSEWYADMVYRQPIAFDVEKVIAELEESSRDVAVICTTDKGVDYEYADGIRLDTAIAVVKSAMLNNSSR